MTRPHPPKKGRPKPFYHPLQNLKLCLLTDSAIKQIILEIEYQINITFFYIELKDKNSLKYGRTNGRFTSSHYCHILTHIPLPSYYGRCLWTPPNEK